MFVNKLPVFIKVVMYTFLVSLGGWFGLIGNWIGVVGVGGLIGVFLFMDWNDWRLRRFFSYNFFLGKNGERNLGIKEVKTDLKNVLRVIKEARSLLFKLEKKRLLLLDKDAPIAKKQQLNSIYFELEKSVEELNRYFWKYSGGADLNTEKGRVAYFIYSGTFMVLYDVGSRLSESSNFVVYLLSIESETFKNLLRSLVFPSTQVFLRSSLYVLDGLTFRSDLINKGKNDFVEEMKSSVGVAQFPVWASIKYYFSLVRLFKQQRLVPVFKSFLLFIDKRRIRKGDMAMNEEDVKEVLNVLEPGDIILVRRALSMTSVIIPGYWTHAALYVGGRDQMKEFFGVDSAGILKKMDELKLGEDKYVLEAIEKGVTASGHRKGLKADSIVVFKPLVGEFDRLKAIEYALDNVEKAYDYGLDFLSEGSFICSELVYKAYSDQKTGEHKLGFVAKAKAGLVFTFSPQDIYEACIEGLGERFEIGICMKHTKNYKKVKRVAR